MWMLRNVINLEDDVLVGNWWLHYNKLLKGDMNNLAIMEA